MVISVYRNKGFDFTITSSTAFDHKWIYGRNIFESISEVVDDVFENYIKSSDRVVSWGKYGITTDKPYDKQAMKMYEDVKDEMLKRMELKANE